METRFGKYLLDRKIGEGGMATLNLATMDGPNGFSKRVVVKRIRSLFSRQASFRRMLGQEAKVAALLSHPNIVQVFDFGEHDGENYLTMEYVEGASLGRIARYLHSQGRTLSLSAAVYVGLSVADALDYIHAGVEMDGVRTPLVHRDVSPSNILVSVRGAIKLTDFGIVKLLQAPGVTDAGVVKGKYGYMAPEQVKGEDLDGRADLFALGAVLWEAVAGRPLFRRADVAATIAAVLSGRVPSLEDMAPRTPKGVDRVLSKAVASRRQDRFSDARELLDELSSLVTQEELSRGQQELAELAALLASASMEEGWSQSVDIPVVRTEPLPSGSYGARAMDEPASDGANPLIWVGLVTAAVVASALVWAMILT